MHSRPSPYFAKAAKPFLPSPTRRSAATFALLAAVPVAVFSTGCSTSATFTGQAATGQAAAGQATADQSATASSDSNPAIALGAAAPATTLSFPAGFMPSVKSYGAVGDGITDDTAAIQAALADGRADKTIDYYGRPKALYFPPGTYLVHDTLRWIGCCVTLQGAGAGSSIIRLAPSSAGFSNAASPKPLILTPAGNQSFHQNIWDLSFTIGVGNPGATALSYISNNTGAIHNVAVTSEDGRGVAGIDLTRPYAGPLLVRNTTITGFDTGIILNNAEYSTTLEAITLSGQNVAGIRDTNQPLQIRGLHSTNAVPAIVNRGGSVVMLDGQLNGGNSSSAAVQTDTNIYMRNVSSTGYGRTLANTNASPAAIKAAVGSVSELLTGAAQTLTGSTSAGSLKLPVSETPSYFSTSTTDWTAFVPRSYGDTGPLKAALNAGTHTVYFPFGSYFSYNEAAVTVPDSVNRIVGFSSVINGSTGGTNGGGIRFVVTGNSTEPLVIEQFGYGLKIDHRGTRPVVVKDARLTYTSSPGAGNLYLEDVETTAISLQPGQHVWARQLNDEAAGTKIVNNGANLWILGLKTERAGMVIDTKGGGKTELLGGLLYPAATVPGSDMAFRSTDSQVSYIYTESVYCSGCGYTTQVDEMRSSTEKRVTAPSSSNFRMPLFVGYQ